MRNQNLILEITQFLQEIVEDENINFLKLAESFKCSLYTNTKYNKLKTTLNFQISDGEFLFSVNINKDEDGNITLLNIKKDNLKP